MREVARQAGVSVSTVGNVLNNPDVVAPATRQRVEAAMDRVGFVRSGPARQLRGLPSRIVGVVTLDMANPFYAEVGRGIEDRLAEDGCMVLGCSTDVQLGKEIRALTVLEEHAVRGIIVSPVDEDLDRLTRIGDRGTPVVLLDQPRDGLNLCAATIDNTAAGRLAAEHLISLGHRRLVFLGGKVRVRPVTDRRAGVLTAVVAAGLDSASALVEADLTPSAVVDAAEAAVERLLSGPAPPTGVICLNDLSALGVLGALDRLGVRVPADVSVVGFDDLRFAARLAPPLTTVRLPKYELGRAAADLLLDEDQPDHRHREVRFQPTLVVRDSTAPAGCGSAPPR
jgi:LacI family transcriptional regulator